MTHFLLYNKPHASASGCTLAIVGTLAPYHAKAAYEGRLDVAGARGDATLTSWTGTLPPGAQVSYDKGAAQIVVTWPAYSPGSDADIPNLDFQSGDVDFADGAGIDIRQIPGQSPVDAAVPGNTWYMCYQNVGGESNAMSQAYIPAVPGKNYAASVDLWRASTRKHADGGAVRILFYDADKNQIDGNDGNVVKEQTDRQWHTSTVSKVAPANAAFVRLGVAFFRIHDNDPVLAANLTWNGAFDDGSVPQGTDGTDTYPLTFSVRDSMGCRATWQGTVEGLPPAYGARMWRLWATANSDSSNGAFLNMSLIALQETAGAPNQCVGSGGTASQSSELQSNLGAVNAFENAHLDGSRIDGTGTGFYWHTADQSPAATNSYGGKSPTNPWWAAYDFGVGKKVFVSQVTMVYTNSSGREPADFQIQTSDDGDTWTTVATFANTVAQWVENKPTTFQIGSPP